MSESSSSNSGESSYSRSSSFSESPSESNFNRYTRASNTASNISKKDNISKNDEDNIKKNKEDTIAKIKDYLIDLEHLILNNFTPEQSNLKPLFIETYRKIIIDNDKKIKEVPTAAFFIVEFQSEFSKKEYDTTFQNIILDSLEEKKQKEQITNTKSKLKYW